MYNIDPWCPQPLNQTSFRQKVSILHHGLQSGGFFTWNVGENDRNSTQHVIQIDQVPNLPKVTNICNLHILHLCYS
jgi:hypothetical protein